jgi:hypothetical protein
VADAVFPMAVTVAVLSAEVIVALPPTSVTQLETPLKVPASAVPPPVADAVFPVAVRLAVSPVAVIDEVTVPIVVSLTPSK